MNWYESYKNHKIFAIAQQAQPASGQQIQQLPEEEIKQNSSKIMDFAIKWLIKNAEPVVEYMMNPNEQAKQNLAKQAIKAAINEGLGNIPFAGVILKNLGIGGAVSNMPSIQQIGNSLIDFISKNFNLGMIPDNISSQNRLLQQFDFPDQMITQQVQSAIQVLRAKYANNPQVISQYMIILLRLKDRMDLLNVQANMMQKAI